MTQPSLNNRLQPSGRGCAKGQGGDSSSPCRIGARCALVHRKSIDVCSFREMIVKAQLKYLEHLIGQPARTGEADYIMIQAMAKFLRFEADDGFDGIIFGSVQSEGRTIM